MMGKRFGGTVVKLVCRLSFESSTCVRKTEDYFTKWGEQALLVAKFVPGLATLAAPVAGTLSLALSIRQAACIALRTRCILRCVIVFSLHVGTCKPSGRSGVSS